MEAAPIEIRAQVYTGQTVVLRAGPRVKLNQVFSVIEAVCAPDPGYTFTYYLGDLKLDGDQRVANAGLISGSIIHCPHEPAEASSVSGGLLSKVSEMPGQAVAGASSASEAGQAGLAHFDIKEAMVHMRQLPLHWAAYRGREKAVIVLLRCGVSPAGRDSNGCTPLMLAAAQGHLPVGRLLLESMAGQGVDATDHMGRTALYYAAAMGRYEMVDCLLRNGAQQSLADHKGVTPLNIAGTNGHVTAVGRLVEHLGHEGLEATDEAGRTALHHAARLGLGQEGVVGLLLASGAESGREDKDGMTALALAASRGHVGVVRMLVLHMAQRGVDAAPHKLADALQHAAYRGRTSVVALLLDKELAGLGGISEEGRRMAVICAAVGGHFPIAETLLENLHGRESSNTRNRANMVALQWAAVAGHAKAIAMLRQKGVASAAGRTPLLHACYEGLVRLVHVLTLGMDKRRLSVREYKGMTGLHAAAMKGHQDVVALLLRRGASTQSKDNLGRTPLMHAILARHTGPAKLILEHMETGLEEGDKNGHTALHYAAGCGQEELAALLLGRGAAAASRNAEGMTPLMVAANHGHLQVVELLAPHCSEGLGLEARDKGGMTALYHAAARGHEEVVAFLKGQQARCDTWDNEGITAVMRAAYEGHVRMVHMLLQDLGLGALHQSDLLGKTAMHWAAGAGRSEMITYLMSQGASATTRSAKGLTPLMLAVLFGHVGVVQMLYERVWQINLEEADEGGLTALHISTVHGHVETVAFLLSKQAEPNARDFDDKTPLVRAAQRGHAAVVRLLAQHLGRQRVDETDAEGGTALFWAAREGHEEAVQVLLSSGADAYIKTQHIAETPLMAACLHTHVGAVKKLLQHMGGRGLGERQAQGATALHLACQKYSPGRSEEVARLLLFAGADHTVKDHMGRTPRVLAEEWEGGMGNALFEWWEGELGRTYLLYKARAISEDLRQYKTAPSGPVSAYLQARVAAGSALPTVEVHGGKEREKEEKRRAVLAFAITSLGSDLFTELMQGFPAQRGTSALEAGMETREAQ